VLLWKLILYQSLMILHWTDFIKCIYWKSNSNVKLVLSAPLVWVFIVNHPLPHVRNFVLKHFGLEEQLCVKNYVNVKQKTNMLLKCDLTCPAFFWMWRWWALLLWLFVLHLWVVTINTVSPTLMTWGRKFLRPLPDLAGHGTWSQFYFGLSFSNWT
jgi:hypothetical protein